MRNITRSRFMMQSSGLWHCVDTNVSQDRTASTIRVKWP